MKFKLVKKGSKNSTGAKRYKIVNIYKPKQSPRKRKNLA